MHVSRHLVALALIAAPSVAGAHQAPSHTATPQAQERCCSLYSAASGPLVIDPAEGGSNLGHIAADYAKLTGQSLILDDEVRELLQATDVGLRNSVAVPALEVQSFFEQLLVGNDFVIDVIRSDAPRVVQLRSLASSSAPLRSKAHFVSAEELPHFAKHPATLITTAVELPNSDVRQLSTSLRALMTNNSTQSIISAGDSRSLIITDFGTNAAALIKLLKLVDATSAVAPVEQPVFAVVALEHASAPSAMETLNSVLLPPMRKTAEGGMSARSANEPRIVADERTNSLVIAAMPKEMATIKGLIANLDAAK